MKSMRKNTKSFILENKTVCPCNVVKSVIFHKGGDYMRSFIINQRKVLT